LGTIHGQNTDTSVKSYCRKVCLCGMSLTFAQRSTDAKNPARAYTIPRPPTIERRA
jgi:hypothetical protein